MVSAPRRGYEDATDPSRFHRPIEGEEGYEAQDEAELKASFSSLAQIVSTLPGDVHLLTCSRPLPPRIR